MIENTIPRKMGISNVVAGYTKVYLAHTQYSDVDVQGKNFYINNPDRQILDNNLDILYTIIDGLKVNTAYTIQGAFFDSMVDTAMLTAKVGIELSDQISVSTKVAPTISSHLVAAPQVDIGVGTPNIVFDIAGDADRLLIESSPAGANTWSFIFNGAKEDTIAIPINPGRYDFRISGIIDLPDGVTRDISVHSYVRNVTVSYQFQPPSTPTNLRFKVAKIMDGIERYDVKVDWNWSKGAGTNVREFVLYFVTTDEYNKNGWSKAATVNSGTSKSAVITGFPFNKEHKFKVSAVAWGPETSSATDSAIATLKVDATTPLDSSFTTDTNIEVTYAHLTAYKTISGVKKQTFKIDAATGSVAIGLLDQQGKAPISVDPVNGALNVDGSVITKNLTTAGIILANLTGKDNPTIRTANKDVYGSAGDGLWTGYDNVDGRYKFDLGNASQNIRWDGNDLVISGSVKISTAGGNVDIGTGAIGKTGAGIYRHGVTPLPAFSNSIANTFFTNLRGSGPVEGDVLTLYDTANAQNTFTKEFDGANWITPALVVDGSIIATSTITADKLVADAAFLNKAGVNVIYDEAAAISADPEATYKMKIDLAAGSIHIR